ncbi:MAG: ATP-binding cassette domain-containing protein [Gammaproteobacteria bacterium]
MRPGKCRGAESLRLPGTWKRPDVVIASILINVLALVMPIVILQTYDRILPNEAHGTFAVLLGVLVIVALFDACLRIVRAAILHWDGARYEHRESSNLVRHMLRSDLIAFNAQPAGYYLDKIQELDKVREHYSGQSVLLFVDLPFVFLFLVLIAAFSGLMVMIPLGFIAIFMLVSSRMGYRLREAIDRQSTMDQRRQNFLIEVLGGLHTVKSMAMESAMLRRYERLQLQSAESVYELSRVNAIVAGIGANFSQIMMVTFVAIGSVAVVNNEMTIGALAAGTMLCGRVLQPTLKAMALWTQTEGVRLAREKTEEILNLPHEAVDEGRDRTRIEGRITLDGIHFRHEGSGRELLSGIDLDVKPGEWIGITGPNGAGKSTLLKLIMGFISPTSGSVAVDGIDIHELDRSAIRAQIGYMPQRGMMFEGTILENMTMFREGWAIDEAIEISRAIGLDQAIRAMPQGLDTRIGGAMSDSLSGGMRNRIMIVRALLGHPSVLLFDDANAGFDMPNDAALARFLRTYKGTRTMILVSHRPSMLNMCDRAFELVDGRLQAIETTRTGRHAVAAPAG